MEIRRSPIANNGSDDRRPDNVRVTEEINSRLTDRQWTILSTIVKNALSPTFNAAEPFLAVRVGLAGITIHHPTIDPIVSVEMADIDHLAALGFLGLSRLPSGARSFVVTNEGVVRVSQGFQNDAKKEPA